MATGEPRRTARPRKPDPECQPKHMRELSRRAAFGSNEMKLSRRAKNEERATPKSEGERTARGRLQRPVRWIKWSRHLSEVRNRRRFEREIRLLCSSRHERILRECPLSSFLGCTDLTERSLEIYSRLDGCQRPSRTAEKSVCDAPSETQTASCLQTRSEISECSQQWQSGGSQNETRSRNPHDMERPKRESLGTVLGDHVCAIAGLLRSVVSSPFRGLRHLTRIRPNFWVFQEKCPFFGSNPA